MSQLYLKIFADLLETQPVNPHFSLDPFIEGQSLDFNIRMFYRLIRWSLGTNNRIGTLVNAYYLGYLLEERASTPRERRQCRKLLTKHYICACTRVYNLFSLSGIQQIYRTQRTEFWTLKLLSKPEYDKLLEDAMNLLQEQ